MDPMYFLKAKVHEVGRQIWWDRMEEEGKGIVGRFEPNTLSKIFNIK